MKTIGRRFGQLLLLALLALSAGMAEAGGYNRLVIFGDSLSDPGNFNAAFGLYTVAPYAPIPPAPYAVGGMHFSNGPTWVEQLATDMHLRTSAGSAIRSPGVASNYAVGGARISDKHANFIVNPRGRARAADIEALIEHARRPVKDRFGIELHPEVRIVGDA